MDPDPLPFPHGASTRTCRHPHAPSRDRGTLLSRIRSRLSAGIAGILVLLCVAALPLVVPGEADAATASGSGRYTSSIYWLDWSKAVPGSTDGSAYSAAGRTSRRRQEPRSLKNLPRTFKFCDLRPNQRRPAQRQRRAPVPYTSPVRIPSGPNSSSTDTTPGTSTASSRPAMTTARLLHPAAHRDLPRSARRRRRSGHRRRECGTHASGFDNSYESNVMTTNGEPWQNIDNTTGPETEMWTSSEPTAVSEPGPWAPGTPSGEAAPAGLHRSESPAVPPKSERTSTATGMQNVMIGVMLPMDFGDAPASYGPAVHLTDWTAVGTNPMAFTGQPGAPGVAFNTVLGNPYLGCVPARPRPRPAAGPRQPCALGRG